MSPFIENITKQGSVDFNLLWQRMNILPGIEVSTKINWFKLNLNPGHWYMYIHALLLSVIIWEQYRTCLILNGYQNGDITEIIVKSGVKHYNVPTNQLEWYLGGHFSSSFFFIVSFF
jgi:hypothetical protein